MSAREPTARVVWLALAIGALGLTLLLISIAFMGSTPGVMGWHAVAIVNNAVMLPCVAFGSVGLLLAIRRPGNAIGWLYLGGGLCLAGFLALNGYYAWASVVRPGAFGVTTAEWVGNWVWSPFMAAMFTFPFLLFPDGHLASPRWRPVVWGSGFLVVAWMAVSWFSSTNYTDAYGRPKRNPLTSEASEDLLGFIEPIVDVGVAVAMALSILSLVVRFRGGSVRERAQIKWLALSGFLAGVFFFIGTGAQWTVSDIILFAVVLSLLPLSMGVAILRYQLYDIDRIVSRTVSYAAVTVVVVATYALVVTSVSRLLPDSGALPVAGATLAAAAVFLPVLRWVRDRVDRRFDRARFDAQQQVEAFAGRMGSAVDVDGVAADLQAVVQRTLAPSALGVWRGGPR